MTAYYLRGPRPEGPGRGRWGGGVQSERPRLSATRLHATLGPQAAGRTCRAREDPTAGSQGAKGVPGGGSAGRGRDAFTASERSPAAGCARRGGGRPSGAEGRSGPSAPPPSSASPRAGLPPARPRARQDSEIFSKEGRIPLAGAFSSFPVSIPGAPHRDTWSRASRDTRERWGRGCSAEPLTCWPARGLPWGALLKKEVLAVKKKSSASSSRLL